MVVNLVLKSMDKYRLAFYTVIIAKIVLSGLFSSGYVSDNFIIFVNWFIQNFQNPWQYFYQNKLGVSFNYPPLMLLVLTPFVWIIDVLAIENVFARNVIFKAPYLMADISILLLLNRLYPEKTRAFFILYFLSPIVIFSTYIISFFDIIPTAICFASMYFLSKQQFKISALFYALAILTKTLILTFSQGPHSTHASKK